MATVQEQRGIDLFMKSWMDKVSPDHDEMEAVNLMARYILQPQPMLRRYYEIGEVDVPAFRMNNRLFKAMYTWMENSGYGEVVQGIERDIKSSASGDRLDQDITSYQNMARGDVYDWESLPGGMGAPARVLLENYSQVFASPILRHLQDQVQPFSFGKAGTMQGINGRDINIRIRKRGHCE